MTGPVDIAEDLGAVPASLPPMQTEEEFMRTVAPAPPQIIRGVLHQGGKMILAGTSKSNKSWSLLDLAISVSSGQEWWGNRTEKARVAYLNFELAPWAMAERIRAVRAVRPECASGVERLHFWHLRGHNADLTVLRPQLETELARHEFGLIILDPAYKLLGNRDENSNGEIASLMNEFEALAQKTGAAIIIAHHFAKGDSSAKTSIDRMSGAGAWARDPDSLFILSPHEEDRCFTVSPTLRNLPMMPEFVLEWDFPLMKLAKDLNPAALRRPQGKNKVCTDREFVETVLAGDSIPTKTIRERAKLLLDLSPRSADRYLARNLAGGVIRQHGGLYWAENKEDTNN